MTTVLSEPTQVRFMRSLRIEATYGAVPWACPEQVSVEWCEPDAMPSAAEINIAIAQLSAVPALARIDGEPRVPQGKPIAVTLDPKRVRS